MKQSTSTSLTSSTSTADLQHLKNDDVVAVYMNSLPPRISHLHGGAVDLFFDHASLSIRGEIVQEGHKQEGFYIGFGEASNIDHWQAEMVQQSGRPVIESIDLLSSWKTKQLVSLLAGPREVRLYGRHGAKSDTGFYLKGIEMVSQRDELQRVAFIASEDDPGDIIVLTPGEGYEAELGNLILLP